MREVPKKRNTALQYKSDGKHCACRPIALLFRLHDYVYQTTRYDVDAAVINGNYAASYGVDPDSGIFYENIDLSDDKFTCLIACRTADLDNETYKRVAEVFCSEVTSKVVEEKFNGFFKLVWEEDTAEDAADTETEVTSETTEG